MSSDTVEAGVFAANVRVDTEQFYWSFAHTILRKDIV